MAHLDDVLDRISQDLEQHNAKGVGFADRHEPRSRSRYVGPDADPELVAQVAAGRTISNRIGGREQQRVEADSKGLGAMMVKALAESTGSSGGFLVPADTSAEITRIARAKSVVRAFRPRTVRLRKEYRLADLSTGTTAYYVAENARITPSEPTFAERALLTPKTLAILTPMSLRLFYDADEDPSAEQVLREDIAEVLALREDLAFLRGTGTGGEPTGLRNQPGISVVSFGTNGAIPSLGALVDAVQTVRGQNLPMQSCGWIFPSRTLSTLEKTTDSQGHPLYESSELLSKDDHVGLSGKLLGYPYRISNQLPVNLTHGSATNASEIYFGDFHEVVIGDSDDLEIAMSFEASYTPDGGTTWISAFQNAQVVLRGMLTHDIGLRRPQAFVVLTGVLPA